MAIFVFLFSSESFCESRVRWRNGGMIGLNVEHGHIERETTMTRVKLLCVWRVCRGLLFHVHTQKMVRPFHTQNTSTTKTFLSSHTHSIQMSPHKHLYHHTHTNNNTIPSCEGLVNTHIIYISVSSHHTKNSKHDNVEIGRKEHESLRNERR